MLEFNKLIKPSLIAGGIAGILSAIVSMLLIIMPWVNYCCCCGWILFFCIFGFISVYLLKKEVETPELIDGAIVGVCTGLVAFVIVTIADAIFWLLFGSVLGMSDPSANVIEGAALGAGFAGMFVLFNGVLRIVIFPIFGAIGGIIGVELLKDKEEPKVEYQAEDVVEEDVVEEDVIEEEK